MLLYPEPDASRAAAKNQAAESSIRQKQNQRFGDSFDHSLGNRSHN
jgi:hypothetical protein